MGPGATTLVPGLFEALKSSVPVIAIVQETPRRLAGKHAASEIDQTAALAPVGKWVNRATAADRAAKGVEVELGDGNAREGAALYVGVLELEGGLDQLKAIHRSFNIY